MRYTDNTAAVLTGASLGAAMMFLLDPNRGRRRRALMRDKLVRSAHVTTDTLQGVSRDLGNRMTGAVASWRGHGEEPVDDQVLVERVRAQMGRVVSNPGRVEVHAGTVEGRFCEPGDAQSVRLAEFLEEAVIRG